MSFIIDRNSSAHDSVAKLYNKKHLEIFSPFEQERLNGVIDYLAGLFPDTASAPDNLSVLDFGAGTGNLTEKFLKKGFTVTAIDVSKKMIEQLKKNCRNYPDGKLKAEVFGGEKIPFADNTFDITATYSVLHHVPDYLEAVREMTRVTKKGGYVYMDHEKNDNFWNHEKTLMEYKQFTTDSVPVMIKDFIKSGEIFSFNLYKSTLIRWLGNKRYPREGDIHVWPDDYVEWEKIKKLMHDLNCEIVLESEYLIYKGKEPVELYEQYKDKCSDTKMMIFRKK